MVGGFQVPFHHHVVIVCFYCQLVDSNIAVTEAVMNQIKDDTNTLIISSLTDKSEIESSDCFVSLLMVADVIMQFAISD